MTGLSIHTLYDQDYSFLLKMPNLKFLSIVGAGSNELNLCNQKNLEILILSNRKVISNLNNCTNLKKVDIWGYAGKDLEFLRDFSALENLTIKGGKKLRNIQALNSKINLKELVLADCQKIIDYETLIDLPNLHNLDIADCGKVNSIRANA